MVDFISMRLRIGAFYGFWPGFSTLGGHNWVNGCRFDETLRASYGIERIAPAFGAPAFGAPAFGLATISAIMSGSMGVAPGNNGGGGMNARDQVTAPE
jgi:hypothetical protein